MSDPQFARGYVREDGYIFQKYKTVGNKQHAVFMSPKAHLREKMQTVLYNARKRSIEYNLAFDLDADYLLSIYPEDNKCPALGMEMCFRMGSVTGPLMNSPSLDRIIPSLGYIKGNVIFVSHLANTIKSNATPDQIKKVAEFYEDLYSQE